MATARKKAEKPEGSSDSTGDDKAATLKSPWGSKVTVAADEVQMYLDGGFTK